MKKIKIVSGYTSDIEKELNLWLKNNPNISIISHTTVSVSNFMYQTIIYEETETKI